MRFLLFRREITAKPEHNIVKNPNWPEANQLDISDLFSFFFFFFFFFAHETGAEKHRVPLQDIEKHKRVD